MSPEDGVGPYTRRKAVRAPCPLAGREDGGAVRLLSGDFSLSQFHGQQRKLALWAQPADQVLAGPLVLARLNQKRSLVALFTSSPALSGSPLRRSLPSRSRSLPLSRSASGLLLSALAHWEEIPLDLTFLSDGIHMPPETWEASPWLALSLRGPFLPGWYWKLASSFSFSF